MAIEKVEAFMIECDNCKEHYENYEGFAIFIDKQAAEEDACEDGWTIQDDKHYCDKCHHFDDEDKLILYSKTLRIIKKKDE